MIKAIVLDIGGILYHEEAPDDYKELSEMFNFNLKDFHKAKSKYAGDACTGKLSADSYPKSIAEYIGVKDVEGFKIALEKFREKYLKINNELKELLEKLKQNYLLATLTNVSECNNKWRIKKSLYNSFDIKLISYQEGMEKPNPEFYKLLIKKLKEKNISPEEAIFIDDMEEYLNPAKNLRINTILFKNNKQLIKDLKRYKIRI